MNARFFYFHSISWFPLSSLSRIWRFLRHEVAHNEGHGPTNAKEKKEETEREERAKETPG